MASYQSDFGRTLDAYVETHDVEKIVNGALNLALRPMPAYPFNEMSRLLKLSAPTMRGITDVRASVALDAFARSCIVVTTTTAQGTFEGRAVLSSNASADAAESGARFVNDALSSILIQRDPIDQGDIDASIKREIGRYVSRAGATANALAVRRAALATSLAVSRAGATRKKNALYEHISDLATRTEESFRIPTPIYTLLSGGDCASNDLPVRAVQIVPYGAKTFTDARKLTLRLVEAVQVLSSLRMGRSATGGGLTPHTASSTEECLELIRRAAKVIGANKYVALAIDVDGANLYREGNSDEEPHYDLGYKVVTRSEEKVAEEEEEAEEDVLDHEEEVHVLEPRRFAERLLEWCRTYDVRLLTDPFACIPRAMNEWQALRNGVAEGEEDARRANVTVAARSLVRVPPNVLPASLREGRYHAVHFSLNDHDTLTEAIREVYELQSNDAIVIIDDDVRYAGDAYAADFAVATRCDMIRIQGMFGESQRSTTARLQRIEANLLNTKGASKRRTYVGGACFVRR